MINDIIRWVSEKIGDRRSYPRKTERFAVTLVSGSTRKPATGVEISANGLVFLTKELPAGKELNLAMTIRNREIRARVAVKRTEKASAGGTPVHRIACTFMGIAADDWDAIVRFVNDEPEPENKALDELKARRKEDDAYRLLPLRVQNRLVNILVSSNRLEPPHKDQLPALRLHLIGTHREPDGTQVHRVNVHSRKLIDDQWYAFDTQFLIDSRGNVQEVK